MYVTQNGEYMNNYSYNCKYTKYKYKYNCMYPCLIIVIIHTLNEL